MGIASFADDTGRYLGAFFNDEAFAIEQKIPRLAPADQPTAQKLMASFLKAADLAAAGARDDLNTEIGSIQSQLSAMKKEAPVTRNKPLADVVKQTLAIQTGFYTLAPLAPKLQNHLGSYAKSMFS